MNKLQTEAPPRSASPQCVPPICHSVVKGPTHEVIARRAYDIYLQTGRKQGQCKQNWQQAEQSLHDQLEAVHAAPKFSAGLSVPPTKVAR